MRRILYSIISLALLLAPVAAAQLDRGQHHGHDHGPIRGPVHVPPVAYSFDLQAVPDSALIRGRIEINYRNETTDTLREVQLSAAVPIYMATRIDSTTGEPDSIYANWIAKLPERSRRTCVLDSLLFRGVPLQSHEIAIKENILTIKLPVEIPPGQRVFLMGTLTSIATTITEPCDLVELDRWYPSVRRFHEGVWDTLNAELARFNVRLEVDSSWDVGHPGELINDKEHYGLLPDLRNDSVYVDIVNQYQQSLGGRVYVPEFEGGRKRYTVHVDNALDFPLLFADELLRDRVVVDSVMIEVCYPPELEELWSRGVARIARELIRGSAKALGKPTHRIYRIWPAAFAQDMGMFRSAMTLPAHTLDSSLVYASLADQISRSRFVSEKNFAVGLQLGARQLEELFGEEGLDMMQAYRARLFEKTAGGPESERRYRRVKSESFWQKRLMRLYGDSLYHDAVATLLQALTYEPQQIDSLASLLPALSGRFVKSEHIEDFVPTKQLDIVRLNKKSKDRDSLGILLSEGLFRPFLVRFDFANGGDSTVLIYVEEIGPQKDTLWIDVPWERNPVLVHVDSDCWIGYSKQRKFCLDLTTMKESDCPPCRHPLYRPWEIP